MTTQIAEIHGQDRPFGSEIAVALAAHGIQIASKAVAGPVDILVVNRPVEMSSLPFGSVTDTDFDHAMTDLMYDVVEIVQSTLPRLRPGSRIVLVGSRGHLGAWGGVHHMAASAGLAGLMRTMALEFAGREIAVNLVAAGFIGTAWDTQSSRRQVANAVRLLAEVDTGFIGETVIVDGGRSLRMSESRSQ